MFNITDAVSYEIWLDYMEERGYNRFFLMEEFWDDGLEDFFNSDGDGTGRDGYFYLMDRHIDNGYGNEFGFIRGSGCGFEGDPHGNGQSTIAYYDGDNHYDY